MTCRRMLFLSWLATVWLAVLPHTAWAQAQAGPAYTLKPEYFRVADFKLQSGAVLKDMVIEYATLGEPRRDAEEGAVAAWLNQQYYHFDK